MVFSVELASVAVLDEVAVVAVLVLPVVDAVV